MPRVSLPAAPASARKHGVQAVNAQRQFGFVDDRFADQIGQRHFGGGDEAEALRREMRSIASPFAAGKQLALRSAQN